MLSEDWRKPSFSDASGLTEITLHQQPSCWNRHVIPLHPWIPWLRQLGRGVWKLKKYFTNLIKAGIHHLDQLPGVDSGINFHGAISLYNLHTKVQGILGRNQKPAVRELNWTMYPMGRDATGHRYFLPPSLIRMHPSSSLPGRFSRNLIIISAEMVPLIS